MDNVRLVFLGPPGAGKGTQAKLLSTELGIPHISTGDMLRAEVGSGSPLGARVKDTMDQGKLVSDDLIIEVIGERIKRSDCVGGYVLDGFPRTVAQAEGLKKMLGLVSQSLSAVVFFQLNNEAILSRLEHRRGAEARKDDALDVQLERLNVYEQQTAPLVAFYERSGELMRVDANGSIEQVFDRLKSAVKSLG